MGGTELFECSVSCFRVFVAFLCGKILEQDIWKSMVEKKIFFLIYAISTCEKSFQSRIKYWDFCMNLQDEAYQHSFRVFIDCEYRMEFHPNALCDNVYNNDNNKFLDIVYLRMNTSRTKHPSLNTPRVSGCLTNF